MATRDQCLLDTTEELYIEFKVVVILYIRPVQAKDRSNPSMESGIGDQVPYLTEKLLVIDSY